MWTGMIFQKRLVDTEKSVCSCSYHSYCHFLWRQGWLLQPSNNSTTLLRVIVGRSNDPMPCLWVVIGGWPVGESSSSGATTSFLGWSTKNKFRISAILCLSKIFSSFSVRGLIPLSALLSSFDRHLIRSRNFLELFLFSLILSLKLSHTVFCLFKCIPVTFCLALSGFVEKFVPSVYPF